MDVSNPTFREMIHGLDKEQFKRHMINRVNALINDTSITHAEMCGSNGPSERFMEKVPTLPSFASLFSDLRDMAEEIIRNREVIQIMIKERDHANEARNHAEQEAQRNHRAWLDLSGKMAEAEHKNWELQQRIWELESR